MIFQGSFQNILLPRRFSVCDLFAASLPIDVLLVVGRECQEFTSVVEPHLDSCVHQEASIEDPPGTLNQDVAVEATLRSLPTGITLDDLCNNDNRVATLATETTPTAFVHLALKRADTTGSEQDTEVHISLW